MKEHSREFPDPDSLRAICKQGAIPNAPYKGFDKPTEGSEMIVKCAKKQSTHLLLILVWDGIEDLAQALHDSPEIKESIRVLSGDVGRILKAIKPVRQVIIKIISNKTHITL